MYGIELNGVVKRYRRSDTGRLQTVLGGIDLRIRRGEIVAVVGPSGCGKSTLLRLILGSERPSDGVILINGQPAGEPDRHRGIVYQDYSLFPHMTVLDNILIGLELEQCTLLQRLFRLPGYRRKRRDFREEAERMLARIGLGPDDGQKYPTQLSGGMRQRVAIAQALVMRSAVLLMDEPFGALDDRTRQEMQMFLLERWERSHADQAQRKTVLFVTHDLEEALIVGSRVIVLSQYYADADGAKIVYDEAVSGEHPKPMQFRYTEAFTAALERIRVAGLDATNLQHLHEFDLNHQDAVRPGGGGAGPPRPDAPPADRP